MGGAGQTAEGGQASAVQGLGAGQWPGPASGASLSHLYLDGKKRTRGIFQIGVQQPERRFGAVERRDRVSHVENPELFFKKIDSDT